MTIPASDNEQVQTPPIDVAIVTALPIVRDAVLQHIDGYEIVHDNSIPLTYYLGYIIITETNEYYNVVLIMLSKNDTNDVTIKQIADSIMQMIKCWHPSYVVTIGIADGISEKVSLGDIVIADFVYDHELTRQILE